MKKKEIKKKLAELEKEVRILWSRMNPSETHESEEVLPEKWFVAITEDNKDVLFEYWKGLPHKRPDNDFLGCLTSDAYDGYWLHYGDATTFGYTEITFEQFKKHVLKEEETKNIEAGKWYKATAPADCLWYVEEISFEGEPTLKGYGFLDGTWRDSKEVSYSGNNVKWMKNRLAPATDTEVFEALKAEAERRGFKEGIKYHPVSQIGDLNGQVYEVAGNYETFITVEDTCLARGYQYLFVNGQWATIIDQPEAIEWSKPGQLVSQRDEEDYELVLQLDGTHNKYNFGASVVKGNEYYLKGCHNREWNKDAFTLHTEPITLKNE